MHGAQHADVFRPRQSSVWIGVVPQAVNPDGHVIGSKKDIALLLVRPRDLVEYGALNAAQPSACVSISRDGKAERVYVQQP
jgi:hypothetical protein